MDFLKHPSPDVAPQLLGQILVRDTPEGQVSGRIVEVEAYTQDDPASHTFKGPTARNASMFKKSGTAYVYFTYGMHYCINVVAHEEGIGSGVLIRAIEPIDGIDIMWRRRYKEELPDVPPRQRLLNLTNGPGKVAQAFGVTRDQDGIDLLDSSSDLRFERAIPVKVANISVTKRIGISLAKDNLWRWHTDSPFVSKTRP